MESHNINKPLVSICVPTYNSETTVLKSIKSILSQTYSNIAVILVDNASTDQTVEVANRGAGSDLRFKTHINSANIGAEANFSCCLGMGRGKYTAIFHSDDIYTPMMVEEQVALLEKHPEIGAVFSMAQEIDFEDRKGRVFHLPRELHRHGDPVYDFDEIFRALLRYGNFFFCPSVIARTEIYRDYICKWDAGGFKTSADLDVWLRILLKYKIGIIDKPLLLYRGASPTSYSYRVMRASPAPQDMLLVFDYYVNGPASHIMGKAEKADYSLLLLKSKINRAFNFSTLGNQKAARELLTGLFDVGNIAHSFHNIFHVKTMLYGYAVFFLSWLPLGGKIRHSISEIRYSGLGCIKGWI